MSGTTSKKTAPSSKRSTKPHSKKISATLDSTLWADLTAYLSDFGQTEEDFLKKAISEKISRDRISNMIDTMLR